MHHLYHLYNMYNMYNMHHLYNDYCLYYACNAYNDNLKRTKYNVQRTTCLRITRKRHANSRHVHTASTRLNNALQLIPK